MLLTEMPLQQGFYTKRAAQTISLCGTLQWSMICSLPERVVGLAPVFGVTDKK
jgi:hypothetical protein